MILLAILWGIGGYRVIGQNVLALWAMSAVKPRNIVYSSDCFWLLCTERIEVF